MKTKFTLFIALATMAFFSATAQPWQIPNNNFNTWSGSPGVPTGWVTYESLTNQNLGLAVEDASDKVVGNASLKLSSLNIPGLGLASGFASVGTGALVGQSPELAGLAYAYRPDTISFLFKYQHTSLDTAGFFIDLSSQHTDLILGAEHFLPNGNADTSWGVFSQPLGDDYYDANIPDTLTLQVVASQGTAKAGTVLHVNGIFFGFVSLPTALQKELNGLNLSIYPNPASEALNITSSQDISGYDLLIFDINGRFVSTNILTDMKTSVNLASFASGTYIYKIADRTGNILKQDKFIVAK